MSESATETQKALGETYRVLARKYRPTNFQELIGQEPMVRTLTNAFKTGRIAQAWMLTGVRGVGKTTTARILARALNYKTGEIDQPSVELDRFGEHCKAIMEGRHVDVIEMDAASHTGIDDIRDIIDRVRYAPVSARYKVYIIDEVHMLSSQAFNGLLKTLEEPPPHVKFIFATTEIRKVPITILSRCQRFDLRRVEASLLMPHLEQIAGRESVEIEKEALAMIARAGEGSVRDCLSIMDQAIAHGSGKVTAQEVRDMLGLADRTRTIDLFETVMAGRMAESLRIFRELYDSGADPVVVLTELAAFNHLVTRLRFVPEVSRDASLSEEEIGRGNEFAQSLPTRVLSRSWQMLLKGIEETARASRPVDAAEMVLIRLAHSADLPTLDEAIAQIDTTQAERKTDNGKSSAKPVLHPGVPAGGGSGGQQSRSALARKSVEDIAPETRTDAQAEEPEVTLKSLHDVAALADQHRDLQLKILVRRCLRPVSFRPGRIEVSLTEDAPATLLGDLTRKLTQWTGMRWIVLVSDATGGETLHETEQARHEDAVRDAMQNPAVAAILENFPGARIIDVRLPADEDDMAFDAPDMPGTTDD